MLKQQTPPDACATDPIQPPLVWTIQQRVIPQLLELHGAQAPLPEMAALIDALLVGGSGMEQASAALARGASYDAIMLNLLAPAARALNTMWEQDRCSFATVTLAMWRMRSLMRRLGEEVPAPLAHPSAARSIMISTLPGSQHDFGAAMVSEFFARDGWTAQHARPASIDDLVAEVRAMAPADWPVDRAQQRPAAAAPDHRRHPPRHAPLCPGHPDRWRGAERRPRTHWPLRRQWPCARCRLGPERGRRPGR